MGTDLRGEDEDAVGPLVDHEATQMAKTVTRQAVGQIDLFAWAEDLEEERRRIADINSERAARRGWLVFATDPKIAPDEPGYRKVYATEARTSNQAMAKVRPIAEGRRLHAYRVSGRYRDELAEAQWVAPGSTADQR